MTIEWVRNRPGVLFHLLGGTLVGVAAVPLWTGPSTLPLGELTFPAVLGSSLFYAGYKLNEKSLPLRGTARVLAVTLGLGAAGLVVGAVVVSIADRTTLSPLGVRTVYLTVVAAGLGLGAPLGYYQNQLLTSNRELETRYEQLRKLNNQVSVTYRVLRHNFRNELTVIMGFTDLLHDEATETGQPYLEKLHAHQQRLLQLTETANDIRQVWNLDQQVEQDLVAVVDDTLTRVRDRWPDAPVTVDAPPSAPVLAHPKLERAVVELVANAIEHNDDVRVDVRVRPDAGPGGTTRLTVADTGCGIPDEEILTLQNPEETSLVHGMGLGLRLVQSVVEQSDGELSFEENSPQGSLVHVDLPPAGGTGD